MRMIAVTAALMAFSLSACASTPQSTLPSEPESPNRACFYLVDDWSSISEFQRMFVSPDGMLHGMVGFRLLVNPDVFEANLSADVDAARWLGGLPNAIRSNDAIVSSSVSSSPCDQQPASA